MQNSCLVKSPWIGIESCLIFAAPLCVRSEFAIQDRGISCYLLYLHLALTRLLANCCFSVALDYSYWHFRQNLQMLCCQICPCYLLKPLIFETLFFLGDKMRPNIIPAFVLCAVILLETRAQEQSASGYNGEGFSSSGDDSSYENDGSGSNGQNGE